MHLCFIVEGYPTQNDPFMPFIRELIIEEAKKGVKCTVIAPQSITRAIKHKLPIREKRWIDTVSEDISIDVIQPFYITISNLGGTWSQIRAVRRAFLSIEQSVDALYAHFWHMGVIASFIKTNVPIFVACGESKISVFDRFANKYIQKLLQKLGGVIYVGTKSYLESKKLKLQTSNPYVIAPNGYRSELFYMKDKQTCREKLGFRNDIFIVIFVGAFNERKGSRRLSDAIDHLNQNNNNVYSIFIGAGEKIPTCKNILFSGKLDHSDILDYLCSADVFVLPTTNEGCCNAIVEALACGLPIVSSDAVFNDDILDENNSIRVDSMDINQLAKAIKTLKDDTKLRAMMSEASLRKANELKLERRADRIKSFIEVQLNGDLTK